LKTDLPLQLRVFMALCWTATVATAVAWAQDPAPKAGKESSSRALPPWQRVLKGEDATRVRVLEKTLAEFDAQGEFGGAVAPARELLAIRRRAQGDDHWETVDARERLRMFERVASLPRDGQEALDMASQENERAAKLYAQRKFAEAATLFRHSLSVFRDVLGEEYAQTALSYNNLATALDDSGQHSESEPLFEKALSISRRTLGELHPRTAGGYERLGVSLHNQGRFGEAEPNLRKDLDIRLRIFGEESPAAANGYTEVAINLRNQGRFSEAEPLSLRALHLRQRLLGDNHDDTAAAYDNLANNLESQGRLALAELNRRTALAIWLRIGGDNGPSTVIGYNNLAGTLNRQGKYQEAEQFHRTALAILLATGRENTREAASAYNNVAMDLLGQGKNRQSEEPARKSIEISRRVLGENHPGLATDYNSLASILYAESKYAEAESTLERAVAIGGRSSRDNPVGNAISYGNLAAAQIALGKYTEAERTSRQAIAIRRQLFGNSHPDTVNALCELANCLIAQGRYVEAEAVGREAGRGFIVAWSRLSFSGLGRAESAAERSPLPTLAVLHARFKRDDEAWQQWEQSLARGLFEDLSTARSQYLTPDERRRREGLLGQAKAIENQIRAALSAKPSQTRSEKQLPELEKRRLAVKNSITQLDSSLASKYARTSWEVFTLERIQAHIPADAALIGWIDRKTQVKAADPQGDHWACVVRSRGAPKWIKLPGTGPNQAWTPADDQLTGAVHHLLRDGLSSAWQKPLVALANQRFEPCAVALNASGELPAVTHLIILPSQALAGIPIEALLESWLPTALRYVVSYAPSATLFAWLRERGGEEQKKQAPSRRLLALGDPIPAPPDGPDAMPAARRADALLRESRGPVYDRLPGSRREVEAIAKLFDRNVVYLGSTASETSLESLRASGELGRFAVIHFATHCKIDDGIPMNSCLLLSQVNLPGAGAALALDQPVYDGTLTAGEVMSTWKLNTELVVLSACQTGLGRSAGGEGFVGFAQAFFVAGARSLILSLWEVDDRATSLLMSRFYQNWLGRRPGLLHPISKVEALREAKSWLRGLMTEEIDTELKSIARGEVRQKISPTAVAHPFGHPYYWAGFVLMGDPG
jgi:CHAT domain-containing protein